MIYESNRAPVAVILASAAAPKLDAVTDDCPTALLSVGGSNVIERTIRNCLSCGISQFVLVLGHRADQVKQFVDKTFRGIRVTYVINDRFRHTGTAYALMLAKSAVGNSEFVCFNTGVVFDIKILRHLVDSDPANVLSIDRDIGLDVSGVKVALPEDMPAEDIQINDMKIVGIGKSVDAETAGGVCIGIDKISGATGPQLFAELALMLDNPMQHTDGFEVGYQSLVAKGAVFHALDSSRSNWTRIENAKSFEGANAMFGTPITTVSRGQQRALDEASAKLAASTS